MILTLVTVPLVVLVQDLWLLELIEAVIDTHFFFLVFLVLVIRINNWSFSLNAGEVSLELLLKVSLPDEVEDQIALASFVSVE